MYFLMENNTLFYYNLSSFRDGGIHLHSSLRHPSFAGATDMMSTMARYVEGDSWAEATKTRISFQTFLPTLSLVIELFLENLKNVA